MKTVLLQTIFAMSTAFAPAHASVESRVASASPPSPLNTRFRNIRSFGRSDTNEHQPLLAVDAALSVRGGFSPAFLTPLRAAEMTAHMDTFSVVYYTMPKIAVKQFGTQLDRTNPLLITMANSIAASQLQLFVMEAFIFFAKFDPIKALALSYLPKLVTSTRIVLQDSRLIGRFNPASARNDGQIVSHITPVTKRRHLAHLTAVAASIVAGLFVPKIGTIIMKALAGVGLVRSVLKIVSPEQQAIGNHNSDNEQVAYLTRAQGFHGLQANGLAFMLLNHVTPHKAVAFSLAVTIAQGLTMFWNNDAKRFGANAGKMLFFMIRSTAIIPCLIA